MTKASTKAHNKYNDKTYDRMNIFVPKGQRDNIKQYAALKGLSLNAYIVGLIDKDIEQGNENGK